MLKGFRNFLMRGDVVVVAVGLVVALAFSNLVKAFTDNIINPLIAAAPRRAAVATASQTHGPGGASRDRSVVVAHGRGFPAALGQGSGGHCGWPDYAGRGPAPRAAGAHALARGPAPRTI